MLTEIVSVLFLVGVPIWLVVELVLHHRPTRTRAARPVEARRRARRTGASERLTDTA